MIAKTESDVQHLRTSGKILSDALRGLTLLVVAGATTAQLDIVAEKMIREQGGVPAFLNYKPSGAKYPFPAALCVSINDEVVHGIPSEKRVLQEGDIVSLDLGVSYKGFFTDSAITVCVGVCDANSKKLISATQEALTTALAAAWVGGHIGDIGAAVAIVARKYGFSVVEELGGHAVGKAVHERPFVPNVGTKGHGETLTAGMVLAIEPIFSAGSGRIVLDDDHWTYRTADASRSAHFEQTVILGDSGAEILTPY